MLVDIEVGDPGIYLPKDIKSHITDAWANNPEVYLFSYQINETRAEYHHQNKTLKCDARFDLAVQIS